MAMNSKKNDDTEEDFTTELLNSFNSLKRFESEELDQRKFKRVVILSIVLIVYAISAVYLLTGGVSSFLFSKFIIDNEKHSNLDLTKLEKRIADIENKIATYQSTTTDMTIKSISVEMENLKRRQDVVDASILDNPDKALTTVLLREKQNNIEQSFSDLKIRQLNLESKLDTIIIAPLVISLLGLLIWLLQRLWINRERKAL